MTILQKKKELESPSQSSVLYLLLLQITHTNTHTHTRTRGTLPLASDALSNRSDLSFANFSLSDIDSLTEIKQQIRKKYLFPLFPGLESGIMKLLTVENESASKIAIIEKEDGFSRKAVWKSKGTRGLAFSAAPRPPPARPQLSVVYRRKGWVVLEGPFN